MIDFNKELVTPSSPDNLFLIDFDEVWQQLGYSTKRSAIRALKDLFTEGNDYVYGNDKYPTTGRPSHLLLLSANCFQQIKAIKARKRLSERTEKVIQKKIQCCMGGQSEVLTPAGKIDLLTEKDLIEFKEAKKWKEAIGQVLAYGYYYPSHRKVIYLFGCAHSSFKEMVEKICLKNGVFVEWIRLD
jgi:hypothetical protein